MRRRDLPTRFRATAPVRLDFAGGWTDVPPFSAREGGAVVNAAITLHVTAELELGGPLIRLVSEDLGQQVECVNSGGLVLDGRLNIHKAALRMFPILGHFTLTTRSAAPPGAGLGGSGALDVALVSLLTKARQEQLDARELAEYAWRLEVVEAGIPGGRQDQFAAGQQRRTFHGVANFADIPRPGVTSQAIGHRRGEARFAAAENGGGFFGVEEAATVVTILGRA